MREINFRAWNGRGMVYGGFSIHATGMFMSNENERILSGFKELEPPIMQFTGLLDKNGKEIYEGDIVKVPYYGDIDRAKIEQVEIIDCECNPFNRYNFSEDGYSMPEDSEVIGNIYSNPDLLNQN
jgi:uncharacterized phage protein (TIGR01671 family)